MLTFFLCDLLKSALGLVRPMQKCTIILEELDCKLANSIFSFLAAWQDGKLNKFCKETSLRRNFNYSWTNKKYSLLQHKKLFQEMHFQNNFHVFPSWNVNFVYTKSALSNPLLKELFTDKLGNKKLIKVLFKILSYFLNSNKFQFQIKEVFEKKKKKREVDFRSWRWNLFVIVRFRNVKSLIFKNCKQFCMYLYVALREKVV